MAIDEEISVLKASIQQLLEHYQERQGVRNELVNPGVSSTQRDLLDRIRRVDAEIRGISGDLAEQHRRLENAEERKHRGEG
jgi:hypothetical protein